MGLLDCNQQFDIQLKNLACRPGITLPFCLRFRCPDVWNCIYMYQLIKTVWLWATKFWVISSHSQAVKFRLKTTHHLKGRDLIRLCSNECPSSPKVNSVHHCVWQLSLVFSFVISVICKPLCAGILPVFQHLATYDIWLFVAGDAKLKRNRKFLHLEITSERKR